MSAKPAPANAAASGDKKPARKGRSRKLVWIVVACVVLGAGGGGGWWAWQARAAAKAPARHTPVAKAPAQYYAMDPAFVVNLGIMRLDYTLSPRMTIRSLSQYNSSTRQFSTSVRYNFIYKPGSDLYVVYDGLQGNLPGRPDLRNQQVVLKMTYLLSR